MAVLSELQALIADWRERRYNHQYDRSTAAQFAKGEGKEEAFQEAADELAHLIESESLVQQCEYLRSLVRMDLRKHMKGSRRMRVKHGDEFDPAHHDARGQFKEAVYRALGGDPALI